jgi:hypothetical protein
MTELRRNPLVSDILTQSLRFWNKAMARCDDDLVRVLMFENVQLSLNQCLSYLWSSQLLNQILLCVSIHTLFSEQGE